MITGPLTLTLTLSLGGASSCLFPFPCRNVVIAIARLLLVIVRLYLIMDVIKVRLTVFVAVRFQLAQYFDRWWRQTMCLNRSDQLLRKRIESSIYRADRRRTRLWKVLLVAPPHVLQVDEMFCIFDALSPLIFSQQRAPVLSEICQHFRERSIDS